MLGWGGELPEPAVRTVQEMRSVLADPSCDATGPLYFMYRDLALTGRDRRWLNDQSLRYDLTVIPPKNLCGECVKTKGHHHPANPRGIGYPEIYEVIDGDVYYLLQTRSLSDVVLIAATRGDIVIIPPGYGHVSVNPSPDRTLVMANIVSTAFESEYGGYESLGGAAYYVMADGALLENPRYPPVPPLRRIRAAGERGIFRFSTGPIYRMVGDEGALGFLNRPEEALPLLSALLRD